MEQSGILAGWVPNEGDNQILAITERHALKHMQGHKDKG